MTHRLFLSLALPLLFAFLTASGACPDSDGSVDGGGEGEGEGEGEEVSDELAATYGEAVNAMLQRCFAAVPDAEPIATAVNQSLNVASFVVNLQADQVAVDVEAVAACIEATAAFECGTSLSFDGTLGPCYSMVRGTLAEGEGCDVAWNPFFVGGPSTGTQCAAGLYCPFLGGSTPCGVCTPLPVAGEACGNGTPPCEGGINACRDGVCGEPQDPPPFVFDEVGSSCSAQEPCSGLGGGPGLTCVDGSCAEVTVVGVGDACTNDTGAGELYCRDSSTANTCLDGLCTARPGVGETCGAGSTCDRTTSHCNSPDAPNVCEANADIGESCFSPNADECGGFEATCRESRCIAIAELAVRNYSCE